METHKIRIRMLLFFFVFLLFGFSHIKSQLGWVRQIGGSDNDAGAGIASDGLGGVYTIGSFTGASSFGSFNLSSAGKADIYIVKTKASNGDVEWVRQIGSANEDNGYSVTSDLNGDIYCTGRFSGNVSFGTLVMTSSGAFDAFIVKLNPTNGLVTWAKQLGGIGFNSGLSIATDAVGSLYACGYYQGSAAFGSTTLNPVGINLNAYVTKLNSSTGDFVWAKGFGSAGYTYPTSLSTDPAGDVYLTGHFEGEMILGNDTLTAIKYEDVFISKHEAATGNIVWANAMGGEGDENASAITAGSDGFVYTTGKFEQTCAFGSTTIVSAGGADVFVCKTNATTGEHQWIKQFGGEGYEKANAITHDAQGNIFVTGQFNGIVDFNGLFMISQGNADVFLARLNHLNGNVTWIYRVGGLIADSGYGITIDGTNTLYAMAAFQSTLNIEGQALSCSGVNDVLIMKMNSLTVGLNDYDLKETNLAFYPNPFTKELNILWSGKNPASYSFTLYDMMGRIILKELLEEQTRNLTLTDLAPGIYTAKITSTQFAKTFKLVKE